MNRYTLFAIALCASSVSLLLVASPDAQARAFRVAQVPNGNTFSCGLCHADGGTGPRNAFGADVEANLVGSGSIGTQAVDWAAIANIDSDGDGILNGAELGDPDGTWVEEDGNPDGDISDPSDSASTPGNSAEPAPASSDDTASDDEGCSTTPTRSNPSTLFLGLLLGFAFLVRRTQR